jgi:HSP20 family protein
MRPFGFLGGDPFRELRRLQDEMDRLTGALAPAGGLTATAGFPAVNVYAGRDGIAVVAELPGVEPGDLEVHARQDVLTIAGSRRPAAEDTQAYHRRERRGGAFRRTIQLPFRVDPEPGVTHEISGISARGVVSEGRDEDGLGLRT